MNASIKQTHRQFLQDEQPSAAVAVIRCMKPMPSVLLVRRNLDDRDPWSGHFAFPGGRKEVSDTSLFETCIRETLEETGILLDDTALRAVMEPQPAGRNVKAPLLVQPFLFEVSTRPAITVDKTEISDFVWLDIARFQDPKNHRMAQVMPDLKRLAYPLDDYYLWGFTYGLLNHVLQQELF